MREIKFRGKRLDNREWVYGDFSKMDGSCFISEHSNNCRLFGLSSSSATIKFLKVDANTVGQFTGLTDKNGVEIYGGDRVEVEGRKYTVVFDETRGGWLPFASGDGCGCCESETETPSECEIIGNIHDKE